MMSHLERLQARLLIGTQLDLIGWMLDFEDHGLSPEKEKNWRTLHDTLSQVNLCFHDMEEEMNRTKNDLGDHRMRVLEDAERIGRMKEQLESTQAENGRLKAALHDAIELLTENNINTLKLWRT